MSLGSLMIDIEGTNLSAEDYRLLKHPLIGGVILFTRNYQSPEQLQALTREIHAIRQPPLLIAVDHEGGRVQRFRAGFTAVPAARQFGQVYQESPQKAMAAAQQIGWLLASELRAVGVDFSFTPVLDLDYGVSSVIGNRAYADKPHIVAHLATALRQGMAQAGMVAVGKHFPGHGAVQLDSHDETPVDNRDYEQLYQTDLQAFIHSIRNGLRAVMTAHIVYPQVDSQAATFSKIWLTQILRQQLQFQGVIFSDDLNMGGAEMMGRYSQRCQTALAAGADMILLCNNRSAVLQVISEMKKQDNPVSLSRLLHLHGGKALNWHTLKQQRKWQAAHQLAANLAQDKPAFSQAQLGFYQQPLFG
jgi:beta-N-acetylhexosaminidase